MDNSKKEYTKAKDEQIAALEHRLVVAEVAIQTLFASLNNLECMVASLRPRPGS